VATIAIKSEIGRRNAKDTKFIVPPQSVAAPEWPDALGWRARSYRDMAQKSPRDFSS
jgi:hypothetical protein